MGTKRIGGVWFKAYPDDHLPHHIHGFYAGIEVIIDLRADGTVALAERTDNVRPNNARRSHVKQVLDAASENFNDLVTLWDKNHA